MLHEITLEVIVKEFAGEDTLTFLKREQERMEKLQFWDEVEELKSTPKVWHFHPVRFIEQLTFEEGPITLKMLVTLGGKSEENYYRTLLPFLNGNARKFGLKQPKEIAHFLSQLYVESRFKPVSENLNYSATQMKKIFGCGSSAPYNAALDCCVYNPKHARSGQKAPYHREKLWTQTSHYANNPENLGNYVYADRLGNGNEASGEGYKYRGRGLIQLTGKNNYQSMQTTHNKHYPDDVQDFITDPDLIVNELKYAVESAFVFWYVITPALGKNAQTQDVKYVSVRVNGGEHGYSQRLTNFNKLATILGINQEVK